MLVKIEGFRLYLCATCRYGSANEAIAAARYEEVLKAMGHDITVSTCGLLVSPAFPWLGALPDRIVFDPVELTYGVVEIKGPYSLQDTKGEELAGLSSCSELTNSGPRLRREHFYYSQLLGKMGVSRLCWGDCRFQQKFHSHRKG